MDVSTAFISLDAAISLNKWREIYSNISLISSDAFGVNLKLYLFIPILCSQFVEDYTPIN
jgi:hypothetical protein